MSFSSDGRRGDDRGFSLIEIVVAMGLLSVVLVAALPMFLSMVRSSVTTRMETQGKNLTQERMEQLRDLRFHVDAQNGPFLDLLDIYYTHATVSAAPLAVPVGDDTLTGQYVSSGGGTGGEPVAPYYRVSTGPLDGAPGFSQVIATQFLTPNGSQALDRTRFENSYDSQATDGRDAPPTLMLGITVITTWTEAGRTKTFRTYTQLTDGRPEQPLIQSAASAVAVEISSTAVDGSTLQLQGGVATHEGAQASGSSVSGYVAGAVASRTGGTPVTGKGARFSFPTDTAVTGFGNASPEPSSGCETSWYAFGHTSVFDVTGSIADGVPKAPSDTAIPVPAGKGSYGRLEGTGTVTCGLLSFRNDVSGGLQSAALPSAAFAPPYVKMADGSGSAPVEGSTFVVSSALSAATKQTRAGAAADLDRPVVVFPSAATGNGLVTVQLDDARVACSSSGGANTVSGSYGVVLRWYGSAVLPDGTPGPAQWWQANYSYDSGSGGVVATGHTWDPDAYLVDGVPLSSYVDGGELATVTTSAESGVQGFPSGVISLVTAPTLANESATAGTGHSKVQVVLGQLTCVADDRR